MAPPAPGLDVVGLVPMAGWARRLPGLGHSKEMYPLPLPGGGTSPVVSEHLLGQLARAGARRAYLVLRTGKWDIVEHFRDGGSTAGLDIAYLVARSPHRGVPFTLDTARAFLDGAVVAMGFPDILLSPPDAMARVVERLVATDADVCLGLFPWGDPGSDDMVEVDAAGRVTAYHQREPLPHLRHTWALAAWTPRFTAHLHDLVTSWHTDDPDASAETTMGAVLRAALDERLDLQTVTFTDGGMLDIGSPAALQALPSFLAELGPAEAPGHPLAASGSPRPPHSL